MIHLDDIFKGGQGGLHYLTAVVVGAGASTVLADGINDATTVQIGIVGGLLVGVFYAGATLQKLKDGQKSTNARLSRIERHMGINPSDRDETDEEINQG